MPSKYTESFTDEKYLNRRELSRALNTTFIDSFWKEQEEYRKQYRYELPVSLINRTPIFVTLTPVINDKIAMFENKIDNTLRLYRGLDEAAKYEVRKNAFFPWLRSIAVYEGVQISDISIRALLNGTYREDAPEHMPVIHYLRTLDHYLAEDQRLLQPDDNFLADAFTYLLGVPELTKFYRDEGPNSYRPISIINGFDYDKAPAREIEPMMENLFGMLKGTDKLLINALTALFYVSYIQPFDNLNYPLSILLAKDVYAGSSSGISAFMLPLESLLGDHAIMEAIKECKKDGDLTYFILGCINTMNRLLDNLKDQIQQARITHYQGEYKTLSPAEEKRAEDIDPAPGAQAPEPEVVEPVEEPEPMMEKEAEEPAPAVFEEPVPEEPKPEVIEKKEPKNALKPSGYITPEEMMKETSSVPGYRFGVPSNTLSDKEVKEYVRYLLETNPSLNRKQANFLANHCTPGRYYTIQQYKSFCRCAYETARTSMDHLASEGYYEKLQVKNKFVYRPATKGEKK